MQHPQPSKGYGGAEVDVRKDQHKPKVIGGTMAAVVEAGAAAVAIFIASTRCFFGSPGAVLCDTMPTALGPRPCCAISLIRFRALARVHILVWPWPRALSAPLKLIGFVIYQDHRHDVCF